MKYFYHRFIAVRIATHAQGYTPEREHKKMAVHPVVPLQAYAFNLADVQLLDGGPFKTRCKRCRLFVAARPNRLLHRFYENAGLPEGRCVWWLGK